MVTPVSAIPMSAQRVARIFDDLFAVELNTRLVGGADEPLYSPANDDIPYHRVVFTRDYVASALHEIAHWCVAGEARRQLEDYGYWYVPDGRNAQQQVEFEQVEVKPQAMEWIFSVAAGLPFRISADNLEASLGVSDDFKQAIYRQVRIYCEKGLNDRAEALIVALSQASGVIKPKLADHYALEAL